MLSGEINKLDVKTDSIGAHGISTSTATAPPAGATRASAILIADTDDNADHRASSETHSGSDADDQSSHDSESNTTETHQSEVPETAHNDPNDKGHTCTPSAKQCIAPPNIDTVMGEPCEDRYTPVHLNSRLIDQSDDPGLSESNNTTIVNDQLSPKDVDEIVRSDIDPWGPENLAFRYATVQPDSDGESSGSDIPYRIVKAPQNTTLDTEPILEAPSPISQLGKRKSLHQQTVSFSPDSEQEYRLGAKYSEKEEREGRAFVKALFDKGSTGQEIEAAYNDEFGAPRTVAGLFKKFEIKGGWHVVTALKKEKKRKISV